MVSCEKQCPPAKEMTANRCERVDKRLDRDERLQKAMGSIIISASCAQLCQYCESRKHTEIEAIAGSPDQFLIALKNLAVVRSTAQAVSGGFKRFSILRGRPMPRRGMGNA